MSRFWSVLNAIAGTEKFKKSLDTTKRASEFGKMVFSDIRNQEKEEIEEIKAHGEELRKAEKIQTLMIAFWVIIATYSAVLILRSAALYIRFSYIDIFIIYAPLISFISIISTLKSIGIRKAIRAARIKEETKCQN